MSTVFITGASKGIGKAAAKAFASAGWDLLLTARSKEDLTKLSNELEYAKRKIQINCIAPGFIESSYANDFKKNNRLMHIVKSYFL